MKIKLISDTHHEFDRDNNAKQFIDSLPHADEVDVLVLAGDVATKNYIEDVLKMYCAKFKQIVYIAGNHCQWANTFNDFHDLMVSISARLPNLHYLQNKRENICGQWFVGATLWFPEIEYMPGKSNWIDFRLIQEDKKEIFKEHEFTRKFLKENLQENDILITHHIPHGLLVNPRYSGDSYNCYFVGDVGDIIEKKKPSHVLFGHSHLSVDKEINGIRYILNPRAYPHEWHECGFNPDLIIDTDLDKHNT